MRCSKAKRLIPLYLAPDPSWLRPEERVALETHMAGCDRCRREYDQTRQAIALVHKHWQISEDTKALLEQGQQHRLGNKAIKPSFNRSRLIAWTTAVAACLALAFLGWWGISNWVKYQSQQPNQQSWVVTSSSQDMPIRIELVGQGTRSIIPAGQVIQTLEGQLKGLLLGGRHKVTMNAGTSLSVEPLTEGGKIGYLLNLRFGELFAEVEHDGNPFVVKTPHGRAVITGTTFDVKATEESTTLVVSEGSVRFESDSGVVQVMAGQLSTVATGTSPTSPIGCDTERLTAWAGFAGQTTEVAVATAPHIAETDSILEGLPAPQVEVQTDLEDIDYTQWIEQKRDWFKRQFPWLFELRDALAREGIDVNYPALLLQSSDIWQFRYPAIPGQRIPVYEPNALVQLAARYGRDKQWLETNMAASRPPVGQASDPCGVTAFEEWTGRLLNQQTETNSLKFNEGELLPSQYACWFLATTRTLAILGIRQGFADMPLELKDKVLGLLEDELHILGQCAAILNELGTRTPSTGSCNYLDEVGKLIDEIKRFGELDGRITEYEKDLSQ